MFSALSWWLVVELLGLAALPLAVVGLRWLPDKGYTFAKPLGILLVGYLLWLGASLGIIDNTPTGSALLASAVAIVAWVRFGRGTLAFCRQHWRLILGSELLFTLAFALWVVVRAYNPAIEATEKPMEIAFLSATLRSAHFPPVDPWLSGYGISYYYFGYVLMAMLAGLAAVASPIAFNLAIALLFALTVSGVFALGFNLVAKGKTPGQVHAARGALVGSLAGLLVMICANLEGTVEVLNARGWLPLSIWQWLQIKDMPLTYASGSWLPTDNWWWFRASRVITDVEPITHATRDYTINEFPFFSFLLGDLHPHVLALPFAVLAIALVLNLHYSRDEWRPSSLWRRWGDGLLIALVFGGLGFLNSWDMPAYLLLLVAAYALHRVRLARRLGRSLIVDALKFALVALLASIVLYLPFYIGFRSQAMGLGLVFVRSKPQQFALFWGPLFFLVISWLVIQWRGYGRSIEKPASDVVASIASPRFRFRSPDARGFWVVVVFTLVLILLAFAHAGVAAVLLALLTVGIVMLLRRAQDAARASDGDGGSFVSLLLLAGILLILICEVLFIRDYFGNRMNTVFKLYYQAWLMLAVAGAYVIYYVAIRHGPQISRVLGRGVWSAVALALLAATLVYPVTATLAKTNSFANTPTLDGLAFLAHSQPDDYAAIRWLQANVAGTPTIVEATGNSYSTAGRVSAFTGLPTLLGWDFHEQQWRGSYAEQAKRKADIDTIYGSGDPASIQSLLRRYSASYVYVGSLERETYGQLGQPAVMSKFGTFMDVVYQTRGVTIFKVRL